MNWPQNSKIRANYPLKEKTTFRIGGKARFFCQPKDNAELKSLLLASRKNKLPVFILGAGSNLLIGDAGVKGLVIKLDSPFFKKIAPEKGCIRAGSGVKLAELIKFSRERSLQGLEFLVGIPGTLGGALMMNAGCWESAIGDLVKEIRVMDYRGRIKDLNSRRVRFTYRKSNLGKYIILSALLKIKKGSRLKIRNNITKYLLFRRSTQDLTQANAGCIFKNPPQRYAGKLIDMCGLKGRRIGSAFISERHANFILNQGNAKARDVLQLMRLAQKQVKDKFNLALQPEIKIW